MSGFDTRAGQTRKQWNGLIVNRKDWEAEQPQNYLRPIPDNMTVPDPRPVGTEVFLTPALRREDNRLYYNETLTDTLGAPLAIYREQDLAT